MIIGIKGGARFVNCEVLNFIKKMYSDILYILPQQQKKNLYLYVFKTLNNEETLFFSYTHILILNKLTIKIYTVDFCV